MLNHNYIGSEHLLLGMIHEGEGVAAKALEKLELDLEAVRGDVEEIIGQGQQAPSGHIPFTPRAKRVLELSLREALQLGHNYIGTEHLLLGLIREGQGVGAQVLAKHEIEISRVRQVVIQILSGYGDNEALRQQQRSDRAKAQADQQLLSTDPLTVLDGRISHARLAKEKAIDGQDYNKATGLRDIEKKLLAERNRLAKARHEAHAQDAARDEIEQAEVEMINIDIHSVVALTVLLGKLGIDTSPEVIQELLNWKHG